MVAETPPQLADKVAVWLSNKEQRVSAGDRAQQVASRNSGALGRTVTEIEELMCANVS